MRVAIPTWNNRVSPVFDTARLVLLDDASATASPGRMEVPLVEVNPARRVGRLVELGVGVLICGAISRPLAMMVQASGIRLIGWVAGEVDEVLVAFRSGAFPTDAFMMPGCCGRGMGRRMGTGGRGRQGRRQGFRGRMPG